MLAAEYVCLMEFNASMKEAIRDVTAQHVLAPEDTPGYLVSSGGTDIPNTLNPKHPKCLNPGRHLTALVGARGHPRDCESSGENMLTLNTQTSHI